MANKSQQCGTISASPTSTCQYGQSPLANAQSPFWPILLSPHSSLVKSCTKFIWDVLHSAFVPRIRMRDLSNDLIYINPVINISFARGIYPNKNLCLLKNGFQSYLTPCPSTHEEVIEVYVCDWSSKNDIVCIYNPWLAHVHENTLHKSRYSCDHNSLPPSLPITPTPPKDPFSSMW